MEIYVEQDSIVLQKYNPGNMKLEAIKHQGSKGKNSADAVGEINGDSGRHSTEVHCKEIAELFTYTKELISTTKSEVQGN